MNHVKVETQVRIREIYRNVYQRVTEVFHNGVKVNTIIENLTVQK